MDLYSPQIQLNKANTSNTKPPKPHSSSISKGFVSLNIYDKRDEFDVGNYPSLNGHVPRFTSYGVLISQFIRYARMSSYVTDLNSRNNILTAKILVL